MVGVFRLRGVSNRRRFTPVRLRLPIVVFTVLMTATACGTSSGPPITEVPRGEALPSSLDGLWILENSDLNLDIDIETAEVDGRTSCARLLGSLTFLSEGAIASFSLPGRDDRSCSEAEAERVDELQELLESTASVRAEAGGYRLLDSDGDAIGRLRVGS